MEKGLIRNNRKQRKTIEKLELMKSMYEKYQRMNYKEEREKRTQGQDSELRHSSEDASTFNDRLSEKIEGLLLHYNNLNEKLPHHLRLELLE